MFNLHDLQWEPGNYGKGLVTDDNVVTWITDGQWGGPHHSEMVEDSYPPEGWPHAVIINPEGGFEFSLLSDPAEGERLKEIVETADPRLHDGRGRRRNGHGSRTAKPGRFGDDLDAQQYWQGAWTGL